MNIVKQERSWDSFPYMIELKNQFAKQNLDLFKKLNQFAKKISKSSPYLKTDEFIDMYSHRLEKRGKDLLYLVKKGFDSGLLFEKLATQKYNDALNDFFKDELAILGGSLSPEKSNVSENYKTWLKTNTTYEKILAQTGKEHGKVKYKIYVGNGFSFTLRNRTLQAFFFI